MVKQDMANHAVARLQQPPRMINRIVHKTEPGAHEQICKEVTAGKKCWQRPELLNYEVISSQQSAVSWHAMTIVAIR